MKAAPPIAKPKAPPKKGNKASDKKPKAGAQEAGGTLAMSNDPIHKQTASMGSAIQGKPKAKNKATVPDNLIRMGGNEVTGLGKNNGEQVRGLRGPVRSGTGLASSLAPADEKALDERVAPASKAPAEKAPVLPETPATTSPEAPPVGKPVNKILEGPDAEPDAAAPASPATDIIPETPEEKAATPVPEPATEGKPEAKASPKEQAEPVSPPEPTSSPAAPETDSSASTESQAPSGPEAETSTSEATGTTPTTEETSSSPESAAADAILGPVSEAPPEPAPATEQAGTEAESSTASTGQGTASGPAAKKAKAEPAPAKEEEPKAEDLLTGGGGGGGGPEALGAALGEGNPLDEAGSFEAAEIPEPELDTSSGSGVVKSLAGLPPTQQVLGMKKAGPALNEAQGKEVTEAQDALPELEQPTGLGRDDFEEPETETPELTPPVSLDVGGLGGGEPIDTSHPDPRTPTPGSDVPRVSNEDVNTPNLFLERMRSIQTSDPAVETSAGPRPDVDLSGDANPEQNAEKQAEADAQLGEEKYNADTKVYQDFGENDMYPTVEPEMLSVDHEFGERQQYTGDGAGELPPLSGEMVASWDPQLQEAHREEFDAEVVKTEEKQSEYETQSEEEHQKGMEQIEIETEATKAEQKAAQDQGRADIASEKESWQTENDKVKEQYEKDSLAEKEKVDKDIDDEIKQADADVETELVAAEEEAEAEKQKAENEADKKKKEAEEKRKKRSWWQKIGDAIGDFFNWLKEAVTKIFDALRDLVKGIIELAKKAVSAIIDAARNLVVGLIKAFAEALKAVIRVALAAFPELADKFIALIDEAVEATIAAIDALADALKNTINALLDALGAVIDALLDVLQAYVLAVIAVYEFLIVGLLKLIEGIANLVSAASMSGDFFWDAVFEEMTGQDPSKPLEGIEWASEKEKADGYAQFAEQNAVQEAPEEELGMPETVAPDAGLPTDVEMDQVPELEMDPDFMSLLSSIPDGGSYEMDGAADPVTMDELAAGVTQPQPENTGEAAVMGPQENMEQVGTLPPGMELEGGEGADFASMNDDQKLDWYLNQMAPNCNTKAEDGGGEGGDSEAMSPFAKVGPLSKGQRRGYILSQLKRGIGNWWECNKVTVLLILLGVLLGGAILTVITGGGFLSALPLIMQGLAAIFMAVMIAKMTIHMKDYLTKAWSGDLAGGAKSLAKALAVGAVELIFNVIFKVGGAIFKALKAAIKAILKAVKVIVKAAIKTIVKGVKIAVQTLVKSGKIAGGYMVKGGKYVFKGLSKGFTKGVKSFKSLRNKLLKRFKFKQFKVVRKGKMLQLWGKVNPWYLMGTTSADPKTEINNRKEVKRRLQESADATDDLPRQFDEGATGNKGLRTDTSSGKAEFGVTSHGGPVKQLAMTQDEATKAMARHMGTTRDQMRDIVSRIGSLPAGTKIHGVTIRNHSSGVKSMERVIGGHNFRIRMPKTKRSGLDELNMEVTGNANTWGFIDGLPNSQVSNYRINAHLVIF